MSVCLFACISVAPKGQIPTKFDIWDLHANLSKKSKLVLKKKKAKILSMLHEGLSIQLKVEGVQTLYKHSAMLHYTYIAYLVGLWLI